ncbi:MAG TPA: methyltransferase domain-containing protein, partial [Xanthomonadales bacterium]|nr:methyltransferase domain-containing protein [Xanthomonadales bacterium]
MSEIAACCCDFAADYELNAHPAFARLERRVLGCAYGGTSWTTRAQADRYAPLLELDDGQRLLELGSGAGWPGIYIAARSGAKLTMVDLPFIALSRALERASEELRTPTTAIQASAAALPFTGRGFDAIEHSDVLCCLPEKREMLAECRRVARPGARMLFYVIAPAPGLQGADMAEATETGPPFVDLDGTYQDMLADTGWNLLQREDLSAEYLETLRRMV